MADGTTMTPEDFFETHGGVTVPSAKATRRKERKAGKEAKQYRRTPKPITPRNPKQAAYIDSLTTNGITFGVGPAGVGKTYVPSRVYGNMLMTGRIDKIYVARPNVSKNKHRNGFLPGTLEDKTAPWLVPIFEGLQDSMGKAEFERFRKEKKIEEVPYEFIQGRTFKDAACIIDEAENLDVEDLYITLTRIGEGSMMCLCGDIYQARIPNSGLGMVIQMAEEDEHDDTSVIVFNENECVRSHLAAQWVKSFHRRGHLLGFHDASKSAEVLRDWANCGMHEATNFNGHMPAFMEGAA